MLLPFRDNADTIEEAVTSVLRDTRPAIELLAVDDGSRDGGPGLVETLARHDRRVRLLHTDGVGIVGALEHGRSQAQAPFLARMDGDDISLPGRLEAQLDEIQHDERLGAVGTRVECFPEEQVGEGLLRYVEWQNGLRSVEDHRRAMFVESPLCHPSTLLRSSAIEEVGGYRDVDWFEDYDLWLRLDAAGFCLTKIPSVLLRWRHRDGRMTTTDPRGTPEAFRKAKAHFLAPVISRRDRPLLIWGAGPTGKRFARSLEPHGLRPSHFLDVDPDKIGRTARGAKIAAFDSLEHHHDATVVVAVGNAGARARIRAHLDDLGFVERVDYFCVA